MSTDATIRLTDYVVNQPIGRKVDDLSQQHIQWLRDQNTWANNTIASRIRVLRSVGNAATATREDLETWWTSRAHLAQGTRVVDLSHLREFYNWCEMYEHRMDDPSIRLRAPRIDNALYDDKISNDQIRHLVDALPPDLGRAVMLGAEAGLRVAESANLDWADVDSAQDMLTIRKSKGGKSRRTPVSPGLISWLEAGSRVTTGNVVAGGGKPNTAAQLQRRLNRAMRRAGAEFTSHDLRHRFGIAAYRSSQDLLAVGEMMGHSNVNTTKLYASADSEVKRSIAAAVSIDINQRS